MHGAFFGASLPSSSIEASIAGYVPKRHIAEVAEVFQARWWDYKRLTPGHSFYLFAHCYYKQAHLTAKRVLSASSSKSYAGNSGSRSDVYAFVGPAIHEMTGADIWGKDKAHVTGMWNAMLVADALSIPYNIYVKLAMDIAVETKWKQLPRPNQIYSDRMGAGILDKFEELRPERMTIARHPIYLVENYEGLELQDAYRDWAIEEMKQLRRDLIPTLMQVVYANPQIPEALALQHFPEQSLTRARLLAGS